MMPVVISRFLMLFALLTGAGFAGAFAQNEAFRGGGGSGHGKVLYGTLNCTTIFAGGIADGAEAALFANPLKCDTTIYTGGTGGGVDTGYAFVLNCNFYVGGVGDGADTALYDGTTCGTYLGGLADGWARAITASICNMYHGGESDGWAAAITESICLMYRGGISDGADVEASPTVVNPTLVYWRGANTNWFDSQNWSYCRVPDCGIDAVIPPTANNPVIAANGASVRSITIQAGAGLTINATRNLDVCGDFDNQGTFNSVTGSTVTMVGTVDQTTLGVLAAANGFDGLNINKPSGFVYTGVNTEVKRQLRLINGIVRTNANEMIVVSPLPSAVSDHTAASYIQGNLRRFNNPTGNYDFPVGNATKGYQLAQVFFTAATAITNIRGFFSDYVVVPVINLPAAECGLLSGYAGDVLDNGKWILDAFPAAAAGTGTYTLRLHNANYTNASGVAYTIVKQPTGAAGAWALNGTCNAASTPGLTIRDGMQGFSEFATGMSADPFPLELLSLEAQPEGAAIRINWLSAEEQSFSHFELERSETQNGFLRIATQPGQQQGTAAHAYTHLDRDVRTNTRYYYRLRMVDQDGSYQYSSIVEAILPQGITDLRTIYPNPTSRAVYLEFANAITEPVTVDIINQQGQHVAIRSFAPEGQSILEMDLDSLSIGVYVLVLRKGGQVTTHRVVKVD